MLIECIPNFSEGKNTDIINQITTEIQSVKGIKLLGVEMGESANRTVVTFAGEPDAVCESAFRAIKKASELIDMSQQKGTHPRMGATDVCPLVPISGISMEETNKLARKLAQRIGNELHFPLYCYEFSSTRPHLRKLEEIRTGEYEALSKKMQNTDFQPDFGDWTNYKTAGATVIGARKFLIAYNFNINSTSQKIAQKIAEDVRESGKIITRNKEKVRQNGKCKGVKAIGWKLEGYKFAQVSTNITDISISPVHLVYEEMKKSAKKYGVKITGAELIGLTPLKVMLDACDFYLEEAELDFDLSEAEKVQIAVKYLNLNELTPFKIDEKIIEYKMKNSK